MSIERIDSGSSASSLIELAHGSISGDPGAEIAALLLDSANDSRQQSAAQRALEERRLIRIEDRQIEQMLGAAEATRIAGWARGIGMMASGTLSVIGNASALNAKEKGELVAGAFGGAGKVTEGAMNLGATSMESAAKEIEALATRSGNQAKQAERRLDDLRQQSNEANDLARSALQAASDCVRSETAAEQATLYLRG